MPMGSRNSAPDQSGPLDEVDIDEQWERFAKDGCPDWWLMAKYTSGWLTRTFPYIPFRERLAALAAAPPGSITAVQGAARSQSSPEVELQQAARQAAAESTGAAAAPPARSVSLDVATLASPQPAQHAAVAPVSSTAISSNGPVEAAAMPMASSNSTTGPALGANAAAVSRDAAGVNCGNPLKGLLSCAAPACIAHTAADTPLDPEA